jgi:hypothetical protein
MFVGGCGLGQRPTRRFSLGVPGTRRACIWRMSANVVARATWRAIYLPEAIAFSSAPKDLIPRRFSSLTTA